MPRGHVGVTVLHPASKTQPHPTISSDPSGCCKAYRQPMTAMGLTTADITRRTVVVPQKHMQQAAYLSSPCTPNMLETV